MSDSLARKDTSRVVVAAGLALIAWFASGSAWAETRPNVVLILTDDQGWGDVRSHGNEKIDTPTLDRFAASGARFDRFFVCPMCAPTRASLLTGRWNLRTGASWVSHGKEILRLDEVTLGNALADAGYATGCFGKWHNGEYGPYHPNDRGFQQFVGFCRGAWENYFDAVIEENRKPLATEGYITDVLTDAALEFIEQNRDRPFFCYLPYNAPHHPFQVPEEYFAKYAARGLDPQTACVYGMVENIDENLARILLRLDELNLADNTLVIFTSDNGPARPRYNGGMRGIKASVDEGGVRVPCFIRWPGHIRPGTTVSQIAAHIDLFPTILELCDAQLPKTLPLDGRSLVPLLQGDCEGWPERMLFSHQNRFGETLMTPGAVRSQQYRLVNRGKGYELYDMESDPGQTTDIATRQAEVTRRLAAAYESWYREVTSRGTDAPSLPVGYAKVELTAIQAEDAHLAGEVAFRRKQGWAHDSILHWTSAGDSATWNLDVLRPGRYEIVLMIGSGPDDVGVKVGIRIAGQSAEAAISQAHDPLPADDSDQDWARVRTSGPVPTMTWIPLQLGTFSLAEGPTTFVVSVEGLREKSRFELKEARVRWVTK